MPSTVISRFAYDQAREALEVEFVSGRLYRYLGVPTALAERFAQAFSKGRFFNAEVRDRFPFEEVKLEPTDELWSL